MSGKYLCQNAEPVALPEELVDAAELLLSAIRDEAARSAPQAPALDLNLYHATFSISVDPSNGRSGFEGVWHDALGYRKGQLLFNTDGSYYAEFDVCVPHPSDPRWFVEAVTAWGRDGGVKSEPRLLAAV
ncbi:MAG: hypothetical protein ACFCUG_08590 [Thiotrichales bacterium]